MNDSVKMTTARYTIDIPESDQEHYYRVFEVDRTGKELEDKEDGKLVSSTLVDEVQQDVTDVIIASHGWNTSQLVS